MPHGEMPAIEFADRGGLDSSASRRVVLGAAAGEPCTDGSRCETGQCYDGVCCDAACGGTCRSCGGLWATR